MKKIAIVTGASSGIGKQTAFLLQKAGYVVYGGARKIENDQTLIDKNIQVKNLDVTNSASIKEFVNWVIKQENQIDVLVNCAGYGSYGPIEKVPISEAKNQMNVNVFGLVEMIQNCLPTMRQQHQGKIINISSVAGRSYSYFGGWYHASKWSVEVLSDCLRLEVQPFGIDVVLIEPGLIKTPWGIIAAEHLEQVCKNTAYDTEGQKVANYLKRSYSSNQKLTEPGFIAKKIVQICELNHPKPRYLFGYKAHQILTGYKLLKTRSYDFVIKKEMQKD